MLYEEEREYNEFGFQHWKTNEVFTFGRFLMIIVLIVFYVVWLKLLDKKRTTQLLLIGSLAAVAYSLNSIISGGLLGLVNYSIRIIPTHNSFFSTSITVSPIIVMLAQQYTSSWKGYILWSTIGFAFLNFVVFTIYTSVGILGWHNWNVFFHFLLLFTISIIIRFGFLWVTGTQKRHSQE